MMAYLIMTALSGGRVTDWKRKAIEKMSPDDCQRFEQADIYSHGFTLGALLMLEVMSQKEAVING